MQDCVLLRCEQGLFQILSTVKLPVIIKNKYAFLEYSLIANAEWIKSNLGCLNWSVGTDRITNPNYLLLSFSTNMQAQHQAQSIQESLKAIILWFSSN